MAKTLRARGRVVHVGRPDVRGRRSRSRRNQRFGPEDWALVVGYLVESSIRDSMSREHVLGPVRLTQRQKRSRAL